jgi:TP901 family phage tail tape measure protein
MGKKSLNIFVGLNDSRFQKGMNRVQKRLGKFGKSMKRVGGNLTRSVSMPLALAGGAAVKMAVDFQTSLTKIQTLVGATATEVKAYEQGIKSISSTTAVGQKELAEGLFFITSAGLKGAEALDTLDVAAKASAMGMGEMDSVANALTSIMTAYASEGMTAAKAGDLLHETLKQGKFEAGEFMDKLGSVIPTAAAAGVSMEELGAASATMSKLSGDAAGTLTSMRALMTSLLKPGEQQKQVLKDLKLSTEDLASMMDESLMGTLQHLFGALEGNNEALYTMFGSSKALTGALSTMGLQADTYKEVLDGMNNSQGNVNEGMKIVEKTAGHTLKQAFVDLQNAGIEIGAILLPVVLDIVEGLKKVVGWFTSLDDSTKNIIVTLGLIAMAIGPAVGILGGIATAAAAIASPIGIAVGVVLLLAAAFIYVRENWEAIKERLGDWNWMKNAILDAIGFLLEWNPFSIIIKGYNELLKKFGRDTLVNPFEQMETALDGLKSETKEYENEFGSFADSVKKQAKEAAAAIGLMGKSLGLGGGGVTTGGDEGGGGFTPIQPIAPSGGGGGPLTATLKTSGEAVNKFSDKMMGFFTDMDAGWEAFGETATDKIQNVAAIFSDMANQMSAISDQRFKNEFMNLDIQQQKEIEAVENSRMTAEQKETAIADIEKAGAEKRKEIQLRQAKAQKRSAIFGAIINTAMAVTNALANIPAPFNIPVAIGMGILGAAQIAAISSQPLPALAEGGLAFGPTAALVGDNVGAASDPEVIAPLSKLNGMLGGGSQKVIVEGVIRGEDIWLTNNKQGTRQARIG